MLATRELSYGIPTEGNCKTLDGLLNIGFGTPIQLQDGCRQGPISSGRLRHDIVLLRRNGTMSAASQSAVSDLKTGIRSARESRSSSRGNRRDQQRRRHANYCAAEPGGHRRCRPQTPQIGLAMSPTSAMGWSPMFVLAKLSMLAAVDAAVDPFY